MKYSSGLVSESFWFLEVKKIIKLLHENTTWDGIKDLALNENLFELSKVTRTKRVYGYLKNRISTLDENLINLFVESDLQTQKLINIIAISKNNRLFFEFLYEIYSEKAFMRDKELSYSDINIFFKRKAEQDEVIASWNDVTLKRLRSCYINFLADAGLVTLIDKKYIITPPILDYYLEQYLLDNGEKSMVKALTGGVV